MLWTLYDPSYSFLDMFPSICKAECLMRDCAMYLLHVLHIYGIEENLFLSSSLAILGEKCLAGNMKGQRKSDIILEFIIQPTFVVC